MGQNVCKNGKIEAKDLHEVDIKDLRACNCDRCEPIADQKELEDLRAYRQQEEVRKEAQERAREIAQEIITTGKSIDSELKGMMKEVVEKELAKNGIDMNGRTGRIIEQKMQFDLSPVYMNTQHGRSQLSPQMKQFIHWAKTGEVTDRKVLARGADAAGGYLVPEEFRNEVIRKLEPLTVVRRSGARAFNVNSDAIDIPVLLTNGAGAWIDENTVYPESDPTFGNVRMTPNKYSRLVRTSYELLEDSAINVADLLADIFAEDFAAAEDRAFVNGSGVGQPTGLNVADIPVVAAGAATALRDDLIRLVYSLPRQYRDGAAFYLRGELIQQVRLLGPENTAGIWTNGSLQDGEPARLLGYPVFETSDLPAYDLDGTGTGTAMGSNIIFGNPKYYYIADRQGMRLERSTERYFELGQVAFRSDLRVDGEVALPDGFRKLTGVAHA